MTNDVCRIDDAQWFIRGNIDIPIIGTDKRFVFMVWSSLSEASIAIVEDTWNDPDRARTGPFFGWLNTEIVPYPGTLNLPVEVHIEPPGIVPFIVLHAGTNPLADVQHAGITMARVIEIAEALLPRH